MDVRARSREQCRRALTEHSRRQNSARALAAAERDEIVSERKSQRARDAILRKLFEEQQLTTGELRRSLKVDIRDYLRRRAHRAPRQRDHSGFPPQNCRRS
jgi:hypothetical protein